MKKIKPIITRDAADLAKALGLSNSHASRWELRHELLSKIISIIQDNKLTHSEVAKKVKSSRTRITSILNGNIEDVSTDLLLRILESLGYRVTVSISRTKLAA